MLTVESNEIEGRVEIYFDEAGLRTLEHSIEALKRRGGHDHLMTASWAGSELTEEKQGKGTTLVNHVVLVFKRNSSTSAD
jgi:ATP-dependent Lon protease